MSADQAVALVTGAAGGLGRAIAHRLTAVGLRVLATDRPGSHSWVAPDDAESTAWVEGDLRDADIPARLIDETLQRFGQLDVLVANHAAMAIAPLEQQAVDEWWRHIEINLTATFFLIQAALAPLQESERARIVLVGSEAGSVGMKHATAYSASKSGLAALGKSLARELGPAGIRVNVVAPSYIDTGQLSVDAGHAGLSIAAMREVYGAAVPLGRVARPDEIASVVAYLAGPFSSSITGQVIAPNGGTLRARA